MIDDTRCPNCELLNLPTATICLQCKTPLSQSSQSGENLPPTADYSQQSFPQHHREQINISQQPQKPFAYSNSGTIPQNNKTGRRTYFWYRMFCSILVVMFAFFAIFAFLAALGSTEFGGDADAKTFYDAMVLLIPSVIFGFLYLLGVILPAKPYSWIYGLVLIGLGMTSCVFIPLMVPLLIFWVKPETQAFFERK